MSWRSRNLISLDAAVMICGTDRARIRRTAVNVDHCQLLVSASRTSNRNDCGRAKNARGFEALGVNLGDRKRWCGGQALPYIEGDPDIVAYDPENGRLLDRRSRGSADLGSPKPQVELMNSAPCRLRVRKGLSRCNKFERFKRLFNTGNEGAVSQASLDLPSPRVPR
jgi:hypothetical protein